MLLRTAHCTLNRHLKPNSNQPLLCQKKKLLHFSSLCGPTSHANAALRNLRSAYSSCASPPNHHGHSRVNRNTNTHILTRLTTTPAFNQTRVYRTFASTTPSSRSSRSRTMSSSTPNPSSKKTEDAHQHHHHDGHSNHAHESEKEEGGHHHSFLDSLNPFHSHAHDHSHAELSPDIVKDGFNSPGSRVVLVGIMGNIALTGIKGAAGWHLNSATLLAEALHSLSDLMGDFIVLATYTLSRRKPTTKWPYGLGRLDTIGMGGIGVILVGAAVGIGLHSYHLLTSLPSPSFLHSLPHLPHVLPFAHDHSHHGHDHSHGGEIGEAGTLDPNAAWFALLSVVVKEWLYRRTKKVAEDEGSNVLRANALHHRSDAYTSSISLISILGSSFGLPILDPLGGLFVSFVLLWQSSTMFTTSIAALLDRTCSPLILNTARKSILSVSGVEDVINVRGREMGGGAMVDLDLLIQGTMGAEEVVKLAREVKKAVLEDQGVRDVRIQFHTKASINEDVAEEDKKTK